ncbi:hypothetical protein [Streptacidiphilus sp. PAMC 29251]
MDRIDAKTKQERSPEGQHGQVVAPTQEAIREAIAACLCPFCGRGPYKVLALHTGNRHGIDRHELRRLAGLVKHASICSPEYGDGQRTLLAKRGGMEPRERPKKGRKVVVSDAGRKVMRDNAAKNLHPTTEQRHEGAVRAGAIRGEQLRKERQPCVTCGGEIAFRPGKTQLKTCSDACLRERKAQVMSAARRTGVLRSGGEQR